MHQPANQQKDDEDDAQAVPERRVAREVEPEDAEQRPQRDIRQPVVAAGQTRPSIGEFAQQQTERQRHHEKGGGSQSAEKEAAQQTENTGNSTRQQQPRDRLTPTRPPQKSSRIG